MIDYLAHISADTSRIVELAAAGDLGGGVPCCPDWTFADLVWHLTEVQGFWGAIVEELADSPERVGDRVRPQADADLPAALGAARDRLTAALAGTDPEAPCWTWADDQSVGFVLRRQAHEALIHRVDAEGAAGVDSTLDPELARDGVDEIVTVMLSGVPDWAAFAAGEGTIRLVTTDVPGEWLLELGRMTGTSPTSGKTYDLLAADVVESGGADLTISGTGVDLDLWLWGRGGLDALHLDGDASLAERLRTLSAESTQ